MGNDNTAIKILFTATDKNVQKVLSSFQAASKATADAMEKLVSRTKEHFTAARRQAGIIRDVSTQFTNYGASIHQSSALTQALVTQFPMLSGAMEGVVVAAESFLKANKATTKAQGDLVAQVEDGTFALTADGAALTSVARKLGAFNDGIHATKTTLAGMNQDELPRWLGGLNKTDSAVHTAALSQNLLAGNIKSTATGLQFSNEQVMRAVGFTESHIEALRRSNLNWQEYNKLVDHANKGIVGYDTALKSLTSRYGRSNDEVNKFKTQLLQSTTAIQNLRTRADLMSPAMGNMARQINIAKVATGVFNRDISVTGGQFKILNETGLRTVDMLEGKARALGVLDKTFDSYQRGLQRVTQRSKDLVPIYQSLGSVYNSNSIALDRVAKAVLDSDRAVAQQAATYRAQAAAAKEGSKIQDFYNQKAKEALSDQNRLRVASGLMTGQFKLSGNVLKDTSRTLTNHRKVLGEVVAHYGKGSPQLKAYVSGLRELKIAKDASTRSAQQNRDHLLKSIHAIDRLNQINPELANSLNAVRVQQGLLSGNLKITNGMIQAQNESGLKSLNLQRAQASESGLLTKTYGHLENVIQKVSQTNKAHGDVLREVSRTYADTSKNASILGKSYLQVMSSTDHTRRSLEAQQQVYSKSSTQYQQISKQLGDLNSKQYLQTEIQKAFSKETTVAGRALNDFSAMVDGSSRKLGLNAIQQQGYERGLQKIAGTAQMSSAQIKMLNADYEKVYKALLKMSSQAGLSADQFTHLADKTGTLQQVTRGLADKSYRVLNNEIQQLDSRTGKYVRTQLDVSNSGQIALKSTSQLADQYQIFGKQIGQVSGGLERIYAALRVTASYMVAGSAVYMLVNAFITGKQALFEFHQALKNLQAITGASSGELAVMSEEMKKVASLTKFSATEIGDAMVYIGQAGFTAAESVQVIGAVADLATGTLSTLTDSANLLTTTLRVFQLDASESGRVADVFANAVNKSKTTIDRLNITMNYLGPVAHSAGISLEQTSAAIMVLSNAGIRASTIGTGFRQVISRLLSPTASLRNYMESSGKTVEDFNIQLQNGRTGGNGFATVMQNIAETLQGDVDKAFKGFGLRGANIALVLSRLGSDIEFYVDQASEAGTASKMAATQMEGLVVTAKNLSDKLGLLAITIGETFQGAIKLGYDILRSFVDLLTWAASSPIVRFISSVGLMTLAIAGLYNTLKLLLVLGLYKFLGESVVALFRTTTATTMLSAAIAKLTGMMVALNWQWTLSKGAALGAGTAAVTAGKSMTFLQGVVFTTTAVFRALWGVVTQHPLLAIVAAVSAVIIVLNQLRQATVKAIEANEVNAIKAAQSAKAYGLYADSLEEVESGSSAFFRLIEKGIHQFPELSRTILDASENTEELAAQFRELEQQKAAEAIEKYGIHLDNLGKISGKNTQLIAQANSIIDSNGSSWEVATQHLGAYGGYLQALPLTIQGLLIPVFAIFNKATKGSAVNIKEANIRLSELLKDQKLVASQTGVTAYTIDLMSGKINGLSEVLRGTAPLMSRMDELMASSAFEGSALATALEATSNQTEAYQRRLVSAYGAQDKMKKIMEELAESGLATEEALVSGLLIDDEEILRRWATVATMISEKEKLNLIDRTNQMNKYIETVSELEEKRIISNETANEAIAAEQKRLLNELLAAHISQGAEVAGLIYNTYDIQNKTAQEAYDFRIKLLGEELNAVDDQSVNYTALVAEKYAEMQGTTEAYYQQQQDRLKESYSAQMNIWQSFPSEYDELKNKKMLESDKEYYERSAALLSEELAAYQAHRDEIVKRLSESKKAEAKAIKDAADERKKIETSLRDDILKAEKELAEEIKKINDDLADRTRTIQERIREREWSLLDELSRTNQARQEIEKQFYDFKANLIKGDTELAEENLKSILDLQRHVVAGQVQVQKDGSRQFVEDKEATVRQLNEIDEQLISATEALGAKQLELAEKASTATIDGAKKTAAEQITEIGRTEQAAIQSAQALQDALGKQLENVTHFIAQSTKELSEIRNLQIELDISQIRTGLEEVRELLSGFYSSADTAITFSFRGKGSTEAPITEKVAEIKDGLQDLFKSAQEISESNVVFNFKGFVDNEEVGLVDALSRISGLFQTLQGVLETVSSGSLFIAFTGKSGGEEAGLLETATNVLGVLEQLKVIYTQLDTSIESVIRFIVDETGLQKLQQVQDLHKTLTDNYRQTISYHGVSVRGLQGLLDALSYHRELDGKHTRSTHTISVKKIEENALGGLVGLYNKGGAVFRRFFSGGMVPGTGNRDSVPMNLAEGSYVIQKSAVKSYGRDLLSSLANGKSVSSLLTPGEFVFPPTATRRLGINFLDQLNQQLLNFNTGKIKTSQLPTKIAQQPDRQSDMMSQNMPYLGSLNLSINNKEVGRVYADPDVLRNLEHQVRRSNRLRSN
jgi:TP901 family phage tail tape measure protein